MKDVKMKDYEVDWEVFPNEKETLKIKVYGKTYYAHVDKEKKKLLVAKAGPGCKMEEVTLRPVDRDVPVDDIDFYTYNIYGHQDDALKGKVVGSIYANTEGDISIKANYPLPQE